MGSCGPMDTGVDASLTWRVAMLGGLVLIMLLPTVVAHGVGEADASFIEGNEGVALGPFMYLGAKHMVTGYDHLLFLVGVVFFLYKMRDVAIYVSMFTLGHSATLLFGVLADVDVSAFLVDALIGLSVVYKGFDNLGGFRRILGKQPDTRVAVLVFGLIHGFGLATKLQEFDVPADGLVGNILAFNVGVEIGQVLALAFIVLLLDAWRRTRSFDRHAVHVNVFLMFAGFLLFFLQITGYVLEVRA